MIIGSAILSIREWGYDIEGHLRKARVGSDDIPFKALI